MATEFPLYRLLSGDIPTTGLRSFWRHFPMEQEMERNFVDRVVSFQLRHGFDLVKITPHSSYCVRDYGMMDQYEGDWLGRQAYGSPIIRTPDQWRRLPKLSPHKGELGRHLQCVRAIVQKLGSSAPVVTTVFSPLSQARHLAGTQRLLEHLNSSPDEIRQGLELLAQNVADFLVALEQTGIDGIFYVLQEPGFLSAVEAEKWGGGLNRHILQCGKSPLRMLHVHGEIAEFSPYLDYPVNILHWHDIPESMECSLEAVAGRFSGAVSGGMEWPRAGWSAKEASQASDTLRERMEGKRYLLSGNCVLPVNTPCEIIDYSR